MPAMAHGVLGLLAELAVAQHGVQQVIGAVTAALTRT